MEYGPGSPRGFDSWDIYDSLDRRISSTDDLGRTTRFGYDSRDNVVLVTDPKGPTSTQVINGHTVNADGNATHYLHDVSPGLC
jgi:YD repeat-containing protein